ncbi:FAD-dependent oxidoreductase [Sphingopyxis sp. 550A]
MSESLAQWDIVIVGTGAAGLTAAITARRAGCSVLLVEKASEWGGTSALAGGGIWAPCTVRQEALGLKDSLHEAEAFLADTVPDAGIATSSHRRSSFIQNAPRMVKVLTEEGMKWGVDTHHPDYISESKFAARGRSLDPEIVNAKIAGPWLASMRRNALPIAVRVRDLPLLGRGTSSLRSFVAMGTAWLRDKVRRLVGQVPVGGGQSLVVQLMAIADRLGVEIRLNTELVDVVIERGIATAIRVCADGSMEEIAAGRAIILASGGTGHMAGRAGAATSMTPAEDRGDTIGVIERAGGRIEQLDEALWVPVAMYPGSDGRLTRPSLIQRERALPHALVVDDSAHRFANEALDYYSFAAAMRRYSPSAWLILDNSHRSRYLFGIMLPGRIPKALREAGFFVEADDLRSLAQRCGLDGSALAGTVQRFNEGASRGQDDEFGRGSRVYDRFWGDPTRRNPNLGPVEKPPYRAVRLHIGDAGTKGGAATDAHGRALANATGAPILGLYAVGTAAASLTGKSYPGPGLTLGPAMTFAYIAAEHASLSNRPEPRESSSETNDS